MIRVERDALSFLPRSVPEPRRLGAKAFEPLWQMPRFVAEPWVDGPRTLIVFGRFPRFFDIAGNELKFDNYVFDSCQLAGTVVDAVLGDPWQDGSPTMFIMDVMMWKGEKLTLRPLRERIKYVDKVAGECPPGYLWMYWAYHPHMKECLAHHMNGRVIIKDMAAPYRSMRGWFVKKG